MANEFIDMDLAATLLVAARSGQAGAFDSLIRLCRPFVERHARQRAWDDRDVDDIVQEVWIRLFEHSDTIREPQLLLGWLKVVTARTAMAIGRRTARIVPTEFGDEVAGAASTEDQAIARHQRRTITDGVTAALSRLDERDRRLLMLLHEEASPCYREVSRRVSRPVGSLGPTRQRLLKRLRDDPAVRRLALASA